MADSDSDGDLAIKTPTPVPGNQHAKRENAGHNEGTPMSMASSESTSEAGSPRRDEVDMQHHHHGNRHNGHTMAHSNANGPAPGGDNDTDARHLQSQAFPKQVPAWKVPPMFAHWEIDHSRFEMKRLMGRGSYGSVALAIDHHTGRRVAIKKINNVFDVFENAKRIFREIKILRHLQHINVIKILHLQRPRHLRSFRDLYVVFEAMDTDLAKLTRDETQDLSVQHVRWFLYQLLLGVKYMHSAGVIHRDIKPANILLTESCDLKLCDFGLARGVEVDEGDDDAAAQRAGVAGYIPSAEEAQEANKHNSADAAAAGSGTGITQGIQPGLGGAKPDGNSMTTGVGTGVDVNNSVPGRPASIARQMTKHVVTRWYRAPELPLYNDGCYTPAIDVWSVGCCYAEMLGMLPSDGQYERKALFPGGSCFPLSRGRDGKMHVAGAARDQLNVIFDVLGSPAPEELRRVRTEYAQQYLMTLPTKPGINLARRYPGAPPEAIDLLKRFLRFHPSDRISIDDALAHPFLAPIRRPNEEVTHHGGYVRFRKVDKQHIRQLIVDEIGYYNKGLIQSQWETDMHEVAPTRSGSEED